MPASCPRDSGFHGFPAGLGNARQQDLGEAVHEGKKGLLGSAQTKDLTPHLFHTGGESFLSPNHRVFTSAQFMVDRRSEEGARVGVAF